MDSFDSRPRNQAAAAATAELVGCLDRGGITLTGNARAARALARSYAQSQRLAGRTAWQTPRVFDWESWLDILWKERLLRADESPLLLTPLQERAVWKEIIGTHTGEPESIATLAADAWELLSHYHSHDECRSFWQGRASVDGEAFRNWALTFERECRKNHWMSRSDLASLLAHSIQQGVIEPPWEILLVGFDRITPAQRALLDAAEARGCKLLWTSAPLTQIFPRIVKAKDFREELASCAAWLRHKLDAEPPDVRFAVIVQDIDAARGEIDRTFRRILMPKLAGIESRDPMPYEFSLGQPLATVPVVKAALLLLRWLAAPLAQLEISWLMLSGFLAENVDDAADMAALDAELRRHGKLPPEAPLETLAKYRPRIASLATQRFFKILNELQHLVASEIAARPTRTTHEWVDFASRVLQQAGWPGARTLESLEFQAFKRWDKLSGELAALGFDGGRSSFSLFVTMTERYAEETIFTPESRNAPVQIMGAFESAGQHFDAVWFLGADDQQWPPASEPHPLLPLWLQRKAAMPHALLEADWRLANEVTQRIAASASECIFSYAERDEAGELRPSPLLGESSAAAISTEEFRRQMQLARPSRPALQTDSFEDSPAVPWPRELEAGGADILKRQAACPFQAFATRRLGAEELGVAERGLTPLERGNILHDVLGSLWTTDAAAEKCIRDRSSLLNAKADGSLVEEVEFHIDMAFNKRCGNYEGSEWGRHYLRVEKQRLRSLLLLWLDYEAKRVDFAVSTLEEERKTEINGLKLNLRVDRVDLVPGGKLILDYKTGQVSAAVWDGERPDDPQLPLYGIYGGFDRLRGLLFAQIRSGDTCFKGRVEQALATVTHLEKTDLLVKNPLDENALGAWSDALSNLADQFLAGEASVAPKSYPKTCTHCGLPSLCRVAETLVVLEVEDDENIAEEELETTADE